MASSGIGSSSHMSGELFKMMAGVDLVHVAYRGQASALTDLLGGQVQMDFATMPPAIEYVRTGKLRALAVTGALRSEALPDVPAIGEFLPAYETGLLTGLGAPRNTPVDITEKLNKETNNFLADPRMKARLADLGNPALLGSSADFGRLLADETEKWASVIRAAKIKAE